MASNMVMKGDDWVVVENQVTKDTKHWVLVAQLPIQSLEIVAAMCVHAGFKWKGEDYD